MVEGFEIEEKTSITENNPGQQQELLLKKESPFSKIKRICMNYINRNKFELGLECSLMMIFFSIALWYFLNMSTEYLVLSTQQDNCDTYQSVYSLLAQDSFSFIKYNLYVPTTTTSSSSSSGQQQSPSTMNHTTLELVGIWSSCQQSIVSPDPIQLLDNQNITGLSYKYSEHSFNLTSSKAYIPVEYLRDYDNETISTVVVETSVNATFYDQTTFKSLGTIDNCFKLNCMVISAAGHQEGLAQGILIDNADFYPNAYVSASIGVSKNSVTARCSAVFYGTALPYFTAANSIVLAESGQCTQYTSSIGAISLSLPYAFIALTIVKMCFHFYALLVDKK